MPIISFYRVESGCKENWLHHYDRIFIRSLEMRTSLVHSPKQWAVALNSFTCGGTNQWSTSAATSTEPMSIFLGVGVTCNRIPELSSTPEDVYNIGYFLLYYNIWESRDRSIWVKVVAWYMADCRIRLFIRFNSKHNVFTLTLSLDSDHGIQKEAPPGVSH